MPAAVYEGAGASIGTNTYVVGGGDAGARAWQRQGTGESVQGALTRSITRPDTSFNTTYADHTVADSWDSGPNTNVAHSFTGGTAVGNKLLVMCGFDGAKPGDTNTVEESIPAPEESRRPTPTATPTPTPTPGGTCPPVITESTSQEIVDGN